MVRPAEKQWRTPTYDGSSLAVTEEPVAPQPMSLRLGGRAGSSVSAPKAEVGLLGGAAPPGEEVSVLFSPPIPQPSDFTGGAVWPETIRPLATTNRGSSGKQSTFIALIAPRSTAELGAFWNTLICHRQKDVTVSERK